MALKKIYVIAGPTASGKSRLALQMAETLNGAVINADSMQIYRDLKILSARPNETEMGAVPHLLYGYADAFYENNVQDWLGKAAAIVETCGCPIFVGGTGFYINALINGISPVPDVDLSIRDMVRQMPLEEVKMRVQDCTAIDSQRLRRALEVQLSTGKPLSYFQKLPRKQFVKATFDVFFVHPPRSVLYEQCNKRLVQMVEKGAIDEVRHLKDIGATGGVCKAIGVPEMMAYIEGRLTFNQMIEEIQLATRHYAKRQCTWFKHQLSAAVEITNPADFVFTK